MTPVEELYRDLHTGRVKQEDMPPVQCPSCKKPNGLLTGSATLPDGRFVALIVQPGVREPGYWAMESDDPGALNYYFQRELMKRNRDIHLKLRGN